MITDAIIQWIIEAVVWLMDLLPEQELDTEGIVTAWSQFGALNYFLPIGELMMFVIGAYLVGPAFLAVTLVQWLLVGVVRGGDTKA